MKTLSLMLSCVLIFALCGCDYREIDRGYLVSAIGFSYKNDKTEILVEAIASSGTLDKPSERIILTADGNDAFDAFENLKQHLVKPLYFEHLGTAILTNDTARQGVLFLNSLREINQGVYLVKCDDISALFDCTPSSGLLGYDIIGLIKTTHATPCQLYHAKCQDFCAPVISLDNKQLVITEVKNK